MTDSIEMMMMMMRTIAHDVSSKLLATHPQFEISHRGRINTFGSAASLKIDLPTGIMSAKESCAK